MQDGFLLNWCAYARYIKHGWWHSCYGVCSIHMSRSTYLKEFVTSITDLRLLWSQFLSLIITNIKVTSFNKSLKLNLQLKLNEFLFFKMSPLWTSMWSSNEKIYSSTCLLYSIVNVIYLRWLPAINTLKDMVHFLQDFWTFASKLMLTLNFLGFAK